MAGGYFGGKDRDPTGKIGSDKNKTGGKSTAGGDGVGAGTRALTQGLKVGTTAAAAPGSALAADKAWTAGGNRVVNGRAEKGNSGTTASDSYSPGATEVHPWANTAAVADLLSQGIPGYGGLTTAYRGAKALAGDDSTFGPLGDALGADAGPQRGWQPDRYRGEPSLTGVGGSGGAVNGGDSRSIPGTHYGAGDINSNPDYTGVDPAENPDLGADYSDVMLKDRKRPYANLSMSQLLSSIGGY